MKKKTFKKQGQGLRKTGRAARNDLAAALRWTVRSWLTPAASEARWEQNPPAKTPQEQTDERG